MKKSMTVFLVLLFCGGLSIYCLRQTMVLRQTSSTNSPKFRILTELHSRKPDGSNAPAGAAAYGRAVTLQADGKIVTAGSLCDADDDSICDFTLVRYFSTGGIDHNFGDRGEVVTEFASDGSGDDDGASAIAVQSDGRIIAAGKVTRKGKQYFALARYDISGQLDPSFGDRGKVITDVTSSDHGGGISALAIQPDGKIIAVGGSTYFALVRYNRDGSRDTFFGDAGRTLTRIGATDSASSVSLQGEGKIVVAGVSSLGTVNSWALARFNSDGFLDPTFGNQGTFIVDTDVQGPSDSEEPPKVSMGLQADGKIIVLGDYHNGKDSDFILYRITKDGMPDLSFGMRGKVVTDLSFGTVSHYGRSSALAIQPNDKIVVVGNSGRTLEEAKFVLARHLWDGRLDSSFGNEGKSLVELNSNAQARAIALQPDGKIVVVGDSDGETNDHRMALTRFRSAGFLDTMTALPNRENASTP